MTTVGFLGSGHLGGSIARLAIAAGHRVVLSNSRGPETLADMAAELGPRASAATSRRPLRPLTSSWSRCRSGPFPACPPRRWSGRRSSTRATTAPSVGYGVVDAGRLADSWRQATGTPVWGTPYGPPSNEEGRPAGEDAIRAALAIATR